MDAHDRRRLDGTPTLALADVHRVTTEVTGRPLELFLFDHHRTAFPLWCHVAARTNRPHTLVTLDRHMDLEPHGSTPPDFRSPLPVLDAYARHQLAPTNDSHIRAAFQAGAIDRALVVARSHAPADLDTLRDRVVTAPTLSRLGRDAHALLARDTPLLLDIDLDCFTTTSDGHVEETLNWDADLIDAFLRPPGSEAFWNSVLPRISCVTIAREPYHCGGFVKGARLWIDFCEAFFGRLLGVPSP